MNVKALTSPDRPLQIKLPAWGRAKVKPDRKPASSAAVEPPEVENDADLEFPPARAVTIGTDLVWDQGVEPVPCPICGEIDAWWSFDGAGHCERCEPPNRSNLLAERARLLGRRARRRLSADP